MIQKYQNESQIRTLEMENVEIKQKTQIFGFGTVVEYDMSEIETKQNKTNPTGVSNEKVYESFSECGSEHGSFLERVCTVDRHTECHSGREHGL